MPTAQIAREFGISRNAVAKAIASVDAPEYSRLPAATSFEPFQQQVRLLLSDAVDAGDGTGRACRVERLTVVVSQNVAAIRPDYAPTDPADRIVNHPGDQIQCDLWFPEPKIPVEGHLAMLPVLVVVASFSKFITAQMPLSTQLGAVPRRLIWDNETGIGRRNHFAAGVGEFTGAGHQAALVEGL